MPSRSPARRTSPSSGPGRMSSRRSPGFRARVRTSPERRRRMPPPPASSQSKYISSSRSGSPSRGRERREFRNSSPRRSRSPIPRPVEPKSRGFSPPKRKMSPKRDRPLSLERERERDRMGRSVLPQRKRSRSKSPPLAAVGSRDGHLGSYISGPAGAVDMSPARYQNPAVDVEMPSRRVLSERFRGSRSSSFDKDRGDRPVFRGPEGAPYDISELKKISVDIRRNLPGNSGATIDRTTINPEELVIVRRPDCGDRPAFRGPDGTDLEVGEMKKVSGDARRNVAGKSSTKIERNLIDPEKLVIVRRPDRRGAEDEEAFEMHEESHRFNMLGKEEWHNRAERDGRRHGRGGMDGPRAMKSEGSRPIFDREEIIQSRSERRKYSPPYERHHSVEDHHRVVAIVGHPVSGHRYASPPPRYSESHRSREAYRPRSREREHSSREYAHEYERSYEREKVRDEPHYDRRGGDDFRHDMEPRHHREEPKYSSRRERSRSYERPRDYGDERIGSDLRMRINEKKDRHDDRDGHHRMLEEREHRDRHHSMMQPSPPGSDRRRGPPVEMYGRPGGGGDKRGDDSRMMRHEAMPPERYYQKQPMPPPPDFSSPRPDKFYKSWESSSPEYVPKGKFYYEHDNREEGFVRGMPRGRGMIPRGVPRGRGTMRGRPFRGMGPARGSGFIAHRGMTRRGGFVPRGFFNQF